MMNEHYVIVDWDTTQLLLRGPASLIGPGAVARQLKPLARAIGGDLQLMALVSNQDAPSQAAFAREGFRVWPVNGNRHQVLADLASELDHGVLAHSAEPRVTFVTPDATLERLAERIAQHCQVRVWGSSTSAPQNLRKPDYSFQSLEDLLPDLRSRRVAVLIDWENISIGLAQAGWAVNPERIAEAFKARAGRYGRLQAIYAYADWSALAKSQGLDIQRHLEMAGITTGYVLSMRGKSSSDMCIVEKAHQLLRSSESFDDLVLATGDRDFRSLIETVRRSDKRVILWGKRGCVSPMVSEVADEVEWVDEFLSLQQQDDLDSINRGVSRTEESLIDPLAELVIKVEGLLHTYGWEWVSPGKLLDALIPAQSDADTRAIARERIHRAQAANLLHSEPKPNPCPQATRSTVEALSLNPAHPTVKAVRLVMARVHDRLRHALTVRRMPWVSFSYIADGMEADIELKWAGLARNRIEQARWLNLFIDAGLLVKERRMGPENGTILWLPQRLNAVRAAEFVPQMAAA
jgi:hypothetical protein